jgi:hypothetical protein
MEEQGTKQQPVTIDILFLGVCCVTNLEQFQFLNGTLLSFYNKAKRKNNHFTEKPIIWHHSVQQGHLH